MQEDPWPIDIRGLLRGVKPLADKSGPLADTGGSLPDIGVPLANTEDLFEPLRRSLEDIRRP